LELDVLFSALLSVLFLELESLDGDSLAGLVEDFSSCEDLDLFCPEGER
jgi:hypothetical protein